MKLLTTILLIFLTTTLSAQVGKVGGWNTYTTFSGTPQPGKKYPVLIFFPGLGEIGTDINRLVSNGPHRFIIDGGNPLPGWYVISLQPPAAYPNEAAIKLRRDSLAILYQIDTNRINLTGLSHGGWCSSTFVSGIPNNINTVITVQGVIPDDNQPYPQGFANFKGTGYICFEQRLDGRGGQTIVNYINSQRPGTATFIETNFGGGGHCCWEQFYGGSSWQPAKFAALNNLNIYEWLIAKNAFNPVALHPTQPQAAANNHTFSFDNYSIYYKTTKLTDYNVFNAIGQRVLAGNLKLGINKISITNLPKGFYFFKTKFYNSYKFYKY